MMRNTKEAMREKAVERGRQAKQKQGQMQMQQLELRAQATRVEAMEGEETRLEGAPQSPAS